MHEQVTAVAAEVESILRIRSQWLCHEVTTAAAECEAVFARRASEIRNEAVLRMAIGAPPSLRKLVGVSNLEVPMNRTLGWMLDPQARGPAARRGLAALAGLLDLHALADDVEQGLQVEVLCEASPDPDITRRKPDLMIRTPHAAVLIENKVWASESGPDQYAHYLEVLLRWGGERECRAYLLAPAVRQVPLGWAGALSHRQLADSLRPLVVEPGISFWDRVAYGLIVSDLDPDTRADRMREIEKLVEDGGRMPDHVVATKLSHLLRRPAIDPSSGGL